MPHWSESALQQASQPAANGAIDGAVLECEQRDWEPLAELEDLPGWELRAEIVEPVDTEATTDSSSSPIAGSPTDPPADRSNSPPTNPPIGP